MCKHYFLILFVIANAIILNAQSTIVIDGIEYDIRNNSAWIVSNNQVRGDVVIPSEISYDGIVYPIGGFEESTFWRNDRITSLIIPEGIDTLPYSFCRDCKNLRRISFPSTLKYIGGAAFANCISLDSILLPAGLRYIDYSAFTNCAHLSSINIPESLDFSKTIDSCGFIPMIISGQNCIQQPLHNSRYFLYMPKSYPGKYSIPDDIEAIADCAFANCNSITEVHIPASVRFVGNYAFKKCISLQTVSIPKDALLGISTFEDCTDLKNVLFPDGAYCCDGGGAFAACSNIQTAIHNSRQFVFLPIDYTGEYCVPQGIEFIANFAFSNRQNLTSVNIPNGVKAIGDGAFSFCKNLLKVTVPESLVYAEGTDFMGDSLLDVVCNKRLMVYLNEKHKGRYSVRKGVEIICNFAFRGCSNLTAIRLPSSICHIGEYAFVGCSSIKSITVPKNVKTIGMGVFMNCAQLEHISILSTIPPEVTTNYWEEDVDDESNWMNLPNPTIPIFVPEEALSAYQSHSLWKAYNIQPF